MKVWFCGEFVNMTIGQNVTVSVSYTHLTLPTKA